MQMASSSWVQYGYTLSHEPLNDRAKDCAGKMALVDRRSPKGFDLLESDRQDYDALHLQVEQIRFALLLGHFEWAGEAIEDITSQVELKQFADLDLMLALCTECLKFNEPAPLLENSLQHEWVEIYLGGLHLLAMRKRLRSEDNCDTLEMLERRAKVLDHKLYLALSDPNLYV